MNEITETKSGFDTFLEDKAVEGVTYVKPNMIELELTKEKKDECRQIIMEIRNFGVSQRQMLFLIELLALELENRNAMLALKKVIGEVRGSVPVSKIILE